MKLDILVITAHPDDSELGCSGTIASQIHLGKKVGIVDLTKGELGTRGTPEGRVAEAAESARILGVAVRENAGFADGFFRNDEKHQIEVIRYLRKYQPDIVITNGLDDRHPDHARAASLVEESSFYSGLRMIKTYDDAGNEQEAWRPKQVFYLIQDRYRKPDFVVDISNFIELKFKAIRAFESQFFVPAYQSDEPQSYISSPEFLEFIKARAEEMGHSIGVKYGEGFNSKRALGVADFSVFI